MTTDIIVVGSGAGGLTAATVAALQGMRVTVLEATDCFGGTTAYSGGGVWVPQNRHQKAAGIEDSFESAEAYVKTILGEQYDPEKVSAYIRTASEMLDYLEDNTQVRLTVTTIPDYEPEVPNGCVSRCLLTADYDGKELGDWFSRLRSPIREMGLLHSMQLSPADAVAMQQWNKSFASFKTLVSRFCRYFFDRVRYGRGTFLANGNALAARLLKSAIDAGVSLRTQSRAKKLLVEDGRVVGVEIETASGTEQLRAEKGVILASGGFGANDDMRAKYLPQTRSGYNVQPEGSRGDGISMAVDIGAVFKSDNVANAIWVPASRHQRKDGTTATFPSLFFDRHCPGSIMVDARTGKRFLNEGFHYQSFGETCSRLGIEKVWMLADSRFIKKYGMGMAKPWPFSLRPWLDNGYLIKAETIEDLAAKLAVDPETLRETFERFNRDAAQGVDTEFARGEDAYSAYMGDATHGPNPGLAPLDKPPFYALDVRPSDLCTLAGVDTNANAQVLRDDGSVIEGLYAVGIDANTVMRGFYPGGGTSIGPAMTFGYIAANHISQSN